MVGHLGFEPRLSWFLAMFLYQVGIVTHKLVTCQASDLNLLHGARKQLLQVTISGEDSGNRTHATMIKSHVLYRLSYILIIGTPSRI